MLVEKAKNIAGVINHGERLLMLLDLDNMISNISRIYLVEAALNISSFLEVCF